jgi:hypothetical protein
LRKAETVRELEKCSLLEEVSWRQKSRMLWLKEGDKCTKFFHSIANSNRRYNSLNSLVIGDSLSSDQSEIGVHIFKFYKKLFTEQCRWRPSVEGISFDSILEFEASWMERAFEEEEVGNVVSAMDGFSMAFFKECWDVLRGDIMEVFQEFFIGGSFERVSMLRSFLLSRRFQVLTI